MLTDIVFWIGVFLMTYFTLGGVFAVFVHNISQSMQKLSFMKLLGLAVIMVIGWPCIFFRLGMHRKDFWRNAIKNLFKHPAD
jgi:Na+/proline symporter